MNTKYRKTIIAGNWKMNMLSSDVKPFIEELKPLMPKIKSCETVLCVPAVNVAAMLKAGKEAKIMTGAQDVSKFEKGAYTGEVSASQLEDIGVKYCIVGHSERRAYQKIADVFEQCSYDYDKNSETTKAFYAFVQNKLHYAVTGKTAAELISERATLDSPTMGLTTWKGAPDGKILKSDTLVAKNYLNEKELSRLNRLVTMFIDYAELMAEDEQLMSMQDWLNETDRFLTNNRRKVLDGKGRISREAATKKVGAIYDQFRKKQDAEYISEFDRQTEKYLKGE